MNYAANYSYAELYFEKGEYDKALNHLSKVNIELSQQKQQLKNLLLKIYFEKELFNEAIYLIDSSKHFLSREEEMPQNKKKTYTKFLSFTSELLNVKAKPGNSRLIQLKNRIQKEEYFKNKDWLLEKISEIKN
jgi:tetratricopeptide (TPR) repeat protein